MIPLLDQSFAAFASFMKYKYLDSEDQQVLSWNSCCVGESFPANAHSRKKDEETRGRDMKPRITVITVGVSDLEKSLLFYRDGLGLPTQGIIGREFEHGALALFDLQHGLKLAIFPRSDLALDAKVPLNASNATECTIGHYLSSKAEVDVVIEQARQAGATITDQAHDRPWGIYSGYFQDLDGHLWEVVWDPRFEAEIIE
jgi:catechol 2,3-dioxygenase-like lactoylglutathione lyase family enzyme